MAVFCSQPLTGPSRCGTTQHRLALAARCVPWAGAQRVRRGWRTVPEVTPCLLGPDTARGPLGQSAVWWPGVSSCASVVSILPHCCPQVYIGHSEPVRAVAFTPDQQQLLSVGDAIFLWDVLAPSEKSPPGRQVPALDMHLPGLPLHPFAPPDHLSCHLCSVQGSPGAPTTCEAGEWSHHTGSLHGDVWCWRCNRCGCTALFFS